MEPARRTDAGFSRICDWSSAETWEASTERHNDALGLEVVEANETKQERGKEREGEW